MKNDPLPIHAENIQRLTRLSGLKQAEIARRAGLPGDAFGRYHNGVTEPPPRKVLAIARVFGVPPSGISPEYAHLDGDGHAHTVPTPPAWSIAPSARGKAGHVHLSASVEVPVHLAMQIIELLSQPSSPAQVE